MEAWQAETPQVKFPHYCISMQKMIILMAVQLWKIQEELPRKGGPTRKDGKAILNMRSTTWLMLNSSPSTHFNRRKHTHVHATLSHWKQWEVLCFGRSVLTVSHIDSLVNKWKKTQKTTKYSFKGLLNYFSLSVQPIILKMKQTLK